ncbi:MAG: primosomal protein N' [Hyphomicrobiaceae bacterium]
MDNPSGAEGTTINSVRRMPVLLPVALDQVYDYRVPDDMELTPGAFVAVPFGNVTRIGVVWDKPDEGAKPIPDAKVKPVEMVYDLPPLPEISMRFVEWIARYTLSPRGMVLRLMMGAPAAFEPVAPKFGVRLAGAAPERQTPGRRRVLEVAADGLIRAKVALAQEAGVSTSVIDGLTEAGTLVQVEIPERRLPAPDPKHKVQSFSEEQSAAVHQLEAAIDAERFSVSLLDGITGSGKTEVYFEAVARALAKGRQVLVLLPEIALTTQFLDRFKMRFGVEPVQWHSAVGPAERGRIWRGAATGEARAVIGARSALFLPFDDLGLIVVDEEHDGAFKQEDRVTYHCRDMAIVRGSLGAAPVILASATPSIESHVNARTGRYRHIRLSERYSGQLLPNVEAIDLRIDRPDPGRWMAPKLVQAVAETVAKGEQALLFLNRRGYAPLTLCRSCGHRFQCPQCSAWLVDHRFRDRLVCHHCGFALQKPEHCPKCGDTGSLVPCGPGVERVAEEVAERFPDSRLAILSSDLTPSITELRKIINAVAEGQADIVIGTQIVAKGHNFPGLTLVGVVDGDLGLGGADPRAAERTFQLLHQVTGRAGRAEKAGRGFVQTHMPEHPVMEAIITGDREAFLDREIAARQAAMMPPFGRLAALVISGREKPAVEVLARTIAYAAPPAKTIEVLGPAEAPLAIVRGRHRYRLLVKAPKEVDLQAYLHGWLDALPPLKGDMRLQIDIDPYNFL